MKSLLTLIFTGLILGSSAQAHTLASEQEQQIKQVIKAYEGALNASNTDAIMALYGPSPTFMPQHVPAQQGRAAVGQAYGEVFKQIRLQVEFEIHDVEVLGDTAWARTSSAGNTTILANELVISEGNNELFIFKNESGHWKIHQYLFSTNQARQ